MPPMKKKLKIVGAIEEQALRAGLVKRAQEASPPSAPPPPSTGQAASASPPTSQAASAQSPQPTSPATSAPIPAELDEDLPAPPLQLALPQRLPTTGSTSSTPTLTSASTAASTAETQTFFRSIRCKELETSDAPPKRKRGIVVGLKTKAIVRTTGNRIVVEYSDFHKGPANEKVRSLISRDIGSCVKSNVPMIMPTYAELPTKHKAIVYEYLSPNYAISPDHDGLWNYLQTTAAGRYRDWKSDCKSHWLEWKEELPLEFKHRPDEWQWLCTHFNDPKHQEMCARMKAIRKAPKRMNHHSGTTAFSYRAEKYMLKGHPAGFVAAFEDAYSKDEKGAPHVEAMKEHVAALLQERREKFPDVAPEEPIPLDEQISVISTQVGEMRGTDVRGVGRCMQRDPRKRGGAQRVEVVDYLVEKRVETLVEERLSQAKEEFMAQAKEEVMAQYNEEQAAQKKEYSDLAVRFKAMEGYLAILMLQSGTGTSSGTS